MVAAERRPHHPPLPACWEESGGWNSLKSVGRRGMEDQPVATTIPHQISPGASRSHSEIPGHPVSRLGRCGCEEEATEFRDSALRRQPRHAAVSQKPMPIPIPVFLLKCEYEKLKDGLVQ
jgi:hypothetical protein